MLANYLLPLCSLVVLQIVAEDSQRCTYGAEGDLVGREIYMNRHALLPEGRRQYHYSVPALQGCALNGVSAKVCDLFPPEVTVEAGLAAVRVRRLGPRLRPLHLDLSLYCDPLLP